MRVMRKNDKLQTPKYIIEALGPFDLDPCAGIDTKCAVINFSIEEGVDGLKYDWGKWFVWCNPPFSQKDVWIQRMIEHGNGILILPERGSAPWFGPLAEHCGFYFTMGKKINFVGGSTSNNVGSCLFPFGKKAERRIRNSSLPGHLNKVQFFKPRTTNFV